MTIYTETGAVLDLAEASAQFADQFATVDGFLSPAHEPSAWLRSAIDHASATAEPACRHTRTGQDVRLPFFLPLWDGGVWCSACVPAAQLPKGSAADRTCDRCQRVCAPALGDPIHPASTLFGIAFVAFGLCRSCLALEIGEHR